MKDVTTDWPCGTDTFQGQLDALAKPVVVLHHSGYRRDGVGVSEIDDQALHFKQRAEMIQICAGGERQQHRVTAVVDALAQDHLSIGAFLGNFVHGV
ncbi:hypothetical protein D3C81_1830610 [compost metagenome]